MRSPITFFLVEDDSDDQDFFTTALAETGREAQCIVANDGEEALNILQKNMNNLPDVIFIDHNMPRMSGLKCLREIKKHKVMRPIPVVMYSTSHNEKEIAEAKLLGVKNFFVKTPYFRELVKYLQDISQVATKASAS